MARMLRFVSVLLLLGLVSSLFLTVRAEQAPEEFLRRVEDIDEAQALASRFKLQLVHVSRHGLAVFETTASTPIETLTHHGFSYNHKDVSILEGPNDPLIDDQYALLMMQLFDAWQITTGDAAITVAIIDTGINTAHPEFEGRLSPLSYNSYHDEVGLEHVEDDEGHGTFITGVLGANKNNGIGIAGIAQHVELLIIKANIDGEGSFEASSLIRAVDYAVEQGADIINMSLGSHELGQNEAMRLSLEAAREAGVFVVAASGNYGNDIPVYPAAFETTISVSSVDEFGVLSDFSSYGNTIDIAAPGSQIYTTGLDNPYMSISGTSMASPHVAGILALMLSHFDDLDYEDVIQRLIDGATGEEPETHVGAGIVNAYLSLRYAIDFVVGDEAYAREYAFAGDPITLPDAPSQEDYDFIGWYYDADLTVPIDDAPVSGNTTFYAKFDEHLYHEITIWDGDDIVEVLSVRDGETFTYDAPEKEGYTFAGYYEDDAFEQPLTFSPVYEAFDVYLRYEVNEYTVTLHINGEPQHITVIHGEVLSVENPVKPRHDFAGWYVDDDFIEAYTDEPITETIDLYARFDPHEYAITMMFGDDVFDVINYTYGDDEVTLEPIEQPGVDFNGWYFDDNFTQPFDATLLDGNVIVHAAYEDVMITVTFLDASGAVYREVDVAYGEDVEAPEPPEKHPTDMFTYHFTGWSEALENIMDTLIVEPLYEGTFRPEAAKLSPGVDTVHLGETWVDAGLDAPENELDVDIEGTVDTLTPGFYDMVYIIRVDDDIVHRVTRVVTVLEDDRVTVDITLHPGIATVIQGTDYVEPGATSTHGDVVIEGSVNTDVPGVYTVRYSVTQNGATFVRIRRVHVLPADFEHARIPMTTTRKREGDSHGT